ncbi:hypothetical protein DUNSADRAFT_2740 [Dunaliella salina]|uniref:Uncharacterized protein n=1 Tax=Dunaliella salina TaxID=3046 RepID=A0ABQ7FW01_DUNSA|nr:hypothetical protein DUNSADRAFT_2740 [Dunaliella salina]|eukprot:KAF5826563.1 hypothetical protein DUNSADRAFT_2740 [Dunaliella salina]
MQLFANPAKLHLGTNAQRVPKGLPRLGACRVQCLARPQQQAQKPKEAVQAPLSSSPIEAFLLTSAAAATPLLLDVQDAAASGGQYGILEGRTAALVHPAMNFTFLAVMFYSAVLGYNWRTARELGEEIRELRKQQPASADGPAPPSPEIQEKEEKRKALLAGNPKDKHTVLGSLLLAGGTGIAIEGCVNTFMRTGKLFPGPHLYAGATIVSLWAIAAALVPAMQKGNQVARNTHILLNMANIGLFLWQVPTGLQIVDKVFQFTKWP